VDWQHLLNTGHCLIPFSLAPGCYAGKCCECFWPSLPFLLFHCIQQTPSAGGTVLTSIIYTTSNFDLETCIKCVSSEDGFTGEGGGIGELEDPFWAGALLGGPPFVALSFGHADMHTIALSTYLVIFDNLQYLRDLRTQRTTWTPY
jgi:hypothetical protein